MNKLNKSICVLCLLFSMSGCFARKEYITCETGKGMGDNYHLSYQVFADFNKPYLEKTIIISNFKSKTKAYDFINKYKTLVEPQGKFDISVKNKMFVVTIERYEKAKFKTFSEYKEKVDGMNQKGKVCIYN
ncbi:MAG: hypothetical protein RSC93_11050 [Erysipelotrichaceae bacterium]